MIKILLISFCLTTLAFFQDDFAEYRIITAHPETVVIHNNINRNGTLKVTLIDEDTGIKDTFKIYDIHYENCKLDCAKLLHKFLTKDLAQAKKQKKFISFKFGVKGPFIAHSLVDASQSIYESGEELIKLEDRNSELKKELSTLKSETEKQIIDLGLKVKNLEAKIKVKGAALEKVTNDKEDYRKSIESLVKKIEEIKIQTDLIFSIINPNSLGKDASDKKVGQRINNRAHSLKKAQKKFQVC